MKKSILFLLLIAATAANAQIKRTEHFPDGVPLCDSLLRLKDKILFKKIADGTTSFELEQVESWITYQWLNAFHGKEVEIVRGYDPSMSPRYYVELKREAAEKWMYFTEVSSRWIWEPQPSTFEGWMAWRTEQALGN